jgi:hypothetical protein
VRKETLQQMGLIFKMFANEQKEALYPPLMKQFGLFCPDLELLYPEYLTDTSFLPILRGEQTIKTCYLGYVVDSDAAANAFLDAYEAYGPEKLREGDINVEPGQGTRGGDAIIRLTERNAVLEALLTDKEQHEGTGSAQAALPVMWELPTQAYQGGWVLYMDGHVEWKAYPGDFPMTSMFAQRITEIMQSGKP